MIGYTTLYVLHPHDEPNHDPATGGDPISAMWTHSTVDGNVLTYVASHTSICRGGVGHGHCRGEKKKKRTGVGGGGGNYDDDDNNDDDQGSRMTLLHNRGADVDDKNDVNVVGARRTSVYSSFVTHPDADCAVNLFVESDPAIAKTMGWWIDLVSIIAAVPSDMS